LNELVVDDLSVLGFALTLHLGSESVGELLKVSISASEVSSMEIRELFAPSQVTISPSSPSRTHLTYTPTPPGVYRLNVSLTGSSSGDYKVLAMCSL
jgi:hypothetical protein